MRIMAKPLAMVLSILAVTTPCFADIIPTETAPHDAKAAQAVHAQLEKLGVSAVESNTIVAKLSSDQLHYFAESPDTMLVGQEDLVVMFWYEWIFAAGSIVITYFLFIWADDFFFRGNTQFPR